MSAYADFKFYEEEYLGTILADTEFPPYALRATTEINYITFDRAKQVILDNTDADAVQAIKMATCALAEQLLDLDTNPRLLESEKVGTHAVTYAKTPDIKWTRLDRLQSAAKVYLAHTGLMYRGFSTGEYAGRIDAN